jgi:hypothetical protein
MSLINISVCWTVAVSKKMADMKWLVVSDDVKRQNSGAQETERQILNHEGLRIFVTCNFFADTSTLA